MSESVPRTRFGTAQGAPLNLPVLIALVAVKLLLHLPSLFRYGYFRDELYFLDCGRHLAFGYVDHAPLVGLYAKIALFLGGSLPALRFMPALAGAGLVVLTVLIARRLGGGAWAQALAGVTVIIAPVNLMVNSILSMNAFEPLFWMGGLLVLLHLAQGAHPRLWLLFGAVVGLGLLNKHSTVVFGLAVAVAILLTSLRRELGRPWIWLAAGVALLLFLPNLIWQWQHGLPTWEVLRNVRETGKNVALAPLAFLTEQILIMHPVTLPIWLVGLGSLLVGGARRFRFLGIIYLVLLGIMMALKGKSYYLAPAYPVLLAGGAVAWEGFVAGLGRLHRIARVAVPGIVIAAGAIFAPMFLPVLSPERFVAYQERLRLGPGKTEVAHIGPLPQLWGDQFGWPELVAEVARIYHALPAQERARTGIFASNYGEAGAINLFGPALGLPPAMSAHQNHWLWGPPAEEPETYIWLQWSREALERGFDSVVQVGEHYHPWGMAEENRPIFLCRESRMSLREAWPQLKHWN